MRYPPFVISLIGVGAFALAGTDAHSQRTVEFELAFATMVQDGMVEQDVFVTNASNPNTVLRVPVASVDLHQGSMLFATTEPPPFEPQIVAPTDTYPKGAALGIKLGQWLASKGAGSYACDGDQATVNADFENLIPNGVYTVWNFIDADPPTDPWQTLMMPLGARDGSQNRFTADADGKATYEAAVSPCPQLSGSQTLAGLAVAWHSDGKTYGFSPGDLGVVSHAQLMAIFPHASEAEGL